MTFVDLSFCSNDFFSFPSVFQYFSNNSCYFEKFNGETILIGRREVYLKNPKKTCDLTQFSGTVEKIYIHTYVHIRRHDRFQTLNVFAHFFSKIYFKKRVLTKQESFSQLLISCETCQFFLFNLAIFSL